MNGILEISQIQKKIDDFNLGPINLNIEPGTITALVGNNGSGKSTLLKLIMNQVKPDMGNIKLFNKFVYGYDESWKIQVAYQPQTVIGWNPFTGKTLKEFIAPLYPNWDEELFTKMVNLFAIPLNKSFGKLSQGVRQKLSLALTLPRNTPLMLLDEPTSFMDIPSKRHFIDLVVEWMDQDERAIIMTSHQSEDIMKLADYLCVLQSGKMIGTFEKDELTRSYMRYWVNGELPSTSIPGEVLREGQKVTSSNTGATENYFADSNLNFTNVTALELEEILTLLLQQRR